MPRVSVLIAAYNAAAYIEQALDSVVAQTTSDWEALVADDGSSDDTCAIVERRAAADPRIRLLRAERNGGPSVARNRAIDAACGDWVAVLDADDRWRPHRLERMLDAAQAEGAAIVADNYIRYDEGSQQELGAVLPVDGGVSLITPARFLDSERPFVTVRFGLLKPMVSRGFLNAHAIRYSTEIRYAEDFHFFMTVLLAGGRGVLVHEPLYIYTLPQSMTSKTVSGARAQYPNTPIACGSPKRCLRNIAGPPLQKRAPPCIAIAAAWRRWERGTAHTICGATGAKGGPCCSL